MGRHTQHCEDKSLGGGGVCHHHHQDRPNMCARGDNFKEIGKGFPVLNNLVYRKRVSRFFYLRDVRG